jgi:DNA-binding transcriptional ArsR family regulator/uncharacterized protein YndB with AHSA1/START domain
MDVRADRPTTDAVFKALADPARRRILDLLRERPRTTGELSAAFPDRSRFAVMKHLGVLEQAGVVIVRRQGRERWNHLNAVPLRELYERWVATFDDGWAASILAIERLSEATTPATSPLGPVQEKEIDVTTRSEAVQTGTVQTAEQQREPAVGRVELPASMPMLGSIAIEQEHRIAAMPEHVFQVLIERMGDWWVHPYRFHQDSTIVVEPRVGGLVQERWGQGDGVAYGTVRRFEQGRLFELSGAISMSGAVHGIARFELDAADPGTLLTFSHRAIGELDDETQQRYDDGWRDLLGNLKQIAERV